MTRRTLRGFIAVFCAAAGSPAAAGAQATPAVTVAVVGGRIIDGYGGPVLENGVILVAGDRIVRIGRVGELAVPAGATVIDANGHTVMPGLIDMHVHLHILGHGDYKRWDELYGTRDASLVMPIAARQLLMAGVTTARDLGARLDDIISVKKRIAAGEIPGPRMFVTGPFIQHKAYERYEEAFRWGVNGPEDARRRVTQLLDAGVDMIKLIDQDQMTDAEVAAVVKTTHERGKQVVAHAHRMEEIRIGLKHEVDNFEHTGLGTAPAFADDVMQKLRERNSSLYWTPTISPLYTMYHTGSVFPERIDDPSWHEFMPEEMWKEIRTSLNDIPQLPYYALFPSRIPLLPAKFAQLRQSGVRMMIGTDAGIPSMFHNDATWREMVKWVELGVSPMETIQSATLWPARFLRNDANFGVLAAGRFADIIMVRGDPLTDMSVMRDVKVVIQGGKRVK
ncbi:MAG TPA: amidohydrolase family protein [Gemmatimonadaceae bacterium]|nr:amidohydrolase family protein [Gemmatimonadaceae bacterium]